jgi:hypothetical protein
MPTTECVPPLRLNRHRNPPVHVTFDQPITSSDGGLLLLRLVDQRMGITSALCDAMADRRDPRKVEHTLSALVRQRVFQIAMGYEDANDASQLRHDPLLQAVCDRRGAAGTLASQPTFSRMETTATPRDVVRAQRAHEERWVANLPANLELLVLDIDGTDDPTHGQQQFAFYNSHYQTTIYAPLMVFDQFGALASARLRSGKDANAQFAAPMLERLIRKARKRFPKLRIIVRGDAAFGAGRVIGRLEALRAQIGNVDYVLGVAPNSAIRRAAAKAIERVSRIAAERADQHARCFDEGLYHSETWPYPRRIVLKVSKKSSDINIRCVVTTINALPPITVYTELYSPRGDSENRIKDFKRALSADRLSCTSFIANALRLQLHAAAYALLHGLRCAAFSQPQHAMPTVETSPPSVRAPAIPQFDTLRLRLLKVAAVVRRTVRRIWIALPRAFPEAARFRALAAALS